MERDIRVVLMVDPTQACPIDAVVDIVFSRQLERDGLVEQARLDYDDRISARTRNHGYR